MFKAIVLMLILQAATMQLAIALEKASSYSHIADAIEKFDRMQSDAKPPGNAGEKKVPAVKRGTLAEEVRQLIANGADVNALNYYGRTALMQAMFDDHEDVVELLLANGAKVDIKTRDGETALTFASFDPNPRIVKRLLEAETSGSHESRAGVLEAFIRNPANSDTPTGRTPAALNNQLLCIRLLARHGAQINESDSDGHTLLMTAVMESRTKVVEELFKLGADPHAKDSRGMTALTMASMFGKTHAVSVLLNNGACADDTASAPHGDNLTPLLAAIISNHEDIALLLLEHTPRSLLDLRGPPGSRHSRGGYTALGGAIANNIDALVRKLLKKGANPDIPGDERGAPPLAMAGQQHKEELIKFMLEAGVNLDATDAKGNTALMHIAAYGPNPETLELLIKKGANVNAKNQSGETALDLVRQIQSGQKNAAVLARHGAIATRPAHDCRSCD